jgi:hypothetical protein
MSTGVEGGVPHASKKTAPADPAASQISLPELTEETTNG